MKVFQAMRTDNGISRIPSLHKQVEARPSTAIILCTTTNSNPDENQLCMVTKTKKTTKNQYYWSGSTVFPGGLLHAASDGQFVALCQKYYSLWFKKYHFTFDDIMYRLNGLRELFEETGILLARFKHDINSFISSDNISYPIKASIFDNRNHNLNVKEWRYKIMKDPYEFIALFKSINMIPDILSLVPWARIQTPWHVNSKRWDAHFYLAIIDKYDALIATNGDKDDNGQVVNALGKEIFRIDWVNIQDAFGSKKIDKYKTIPSVTRFQLAELYQIIEMEKCLVNEWENAYVNRNICVLRFKMAVRLPDNDILTLFHGDYLYDKLGDEQDVECDVEKENNPNCLQRIMISKVNGKIKTSVFKVLNQYNRLYPYKTLTVVSKL
eukprot:314581_1